MTESRIGRTIPQLVATELALLREFALCLQREQELLVHASIDRLTPVVVDKSRLAENLAEAAQCRNRALSSAGFASDQSGMEAWLKSHSAQGGAASKIHATVHSDWQAILTLAEQARVCNDINGKLIATAVQHNQRALAVLAAADSALLYGPDGREHTPSGGRNLGVA
jgi:flagella synthesis protein FlgN